MSSHYGGQLPDDKYDDGDNDKPNNDSGDDFDVRKRMKIHKKKDDDTY